MCELRSMTLVSLNLQSLKIFHILKRRRKKKVLDKISNVLIFLKRKRMLTLQKLISVYLCNLLALQRWKFAIFIGFFFTFEHLNILVFFLVFPVRLDYIVVNTDYILQNCTGLLTILDSGLVLGFVYWKSIINNNKRNKIKKVVETRVRKQSFKKTINTDQ